MIVIFRVFGIFTNYFGGSKFYIELQEGASLRNLLDKIDMSWGKSLPPHVWNAEEKKFNLGVLLCDNHVDFTDDGILLTNMQEVYLTYPISGG